MLTPSDWQEVAGATPYFVGDDATTWATDSNSGMHIKTNSNDLGIIAGQQYTITITANGVTYSSTATAGSSSGIQTLMFTFSETANAMVMIYDHADWTAQAPGNGSATMVNPGQNTSLVITNFAGEGFGTTIQATISDSAIKVNSAVTLYVNTSDKIAVGEKTNGSITLTADSIPTVSIPYNLEIVGTDTEGLFEIINGYIPEIPDTPSGVPQWNTIYEDATGAGVDSIDLTTPLKGGDLYRITINGEFYIFCPDEDGKTAIQDIGIVYETLHSGNSSLTHTTIGLTHTKTRLTLSYTAQYNITEAGISNYYFSSTSGMKFTKLEVYR